MANEYRFTEEVLISKAASGFKHHDEQRTWFDDMAGDAGGQPGLLLIGDVEEAVDFGDVSPGWVRLQCLANSDERCWYGPDDNYGTGGGSMARMGELQPGKPPQWIYIPSGVQLKLKCPVGGGTAKVLVLGFDA